MPSDSEYPFGLLLVAGVFLPILAFNTGPLSELLGIGLLEAAAVLFAVPLVVALCLAAVVRGRLETRQQWTRLVGGVGALVAILELAVVGAATGDVHVDRWDVVWLGATIVLSYAMLRFDVPTGTR